MSKMNRAAIFCIMQCALAFLILANSAAAQTLLLSSPDGVVGHPYGETTPLLRKMLEPETELVVDFDLKRVRTEGGLADFQALVLHGHYPPDDVAERAIEAFV